MMRLVVMVILMFCAFVCKGEEPTRAVGDNIYKRSSLFVLVSKNDDSLKNPLVFFCGQRDRGNNSDEG